jgi:maltose alpha-D-glucosyltransferase/alpha-amylase
MSGLLLTNERSTELRRSLPARLPAFLVRQRWFGGKARQILSTEIADLISFENVLSEAIMLIVLVSYTDGGQDAYSLPLMPIVGDGATGPRDAGSLYVEGSATSGPIVLADALGNENFSTMFLHAIEEKSEFSGEKGTLRAFQTEALADLSGRGDPSAALRAGKLAVADRGNSGTLQPKLLTGEQSNTSVIYGDRLILKFFRRIEEGTNPDLEIGRFLTEKVHYKNIAQTAGWLEYRLNGKLMTQAILQAFVPNQGDAWRYTSRSVASFYELATKHSANNAKFSAGSFGQANPEIPDFACACVTPYLEKVRLLGKRTAELHLALAAEDQDPSFAPEPFTTGFRRTLEKTALQLTSKVLALLREKRSSLPAEWGHQADTVTASEEAIMRRFQFLLSEPIPAERIRIHGDYHLGQLLYTGSDFVIIDFEGEPARPLAERRTKQSPLQDVAGMLRSLHYAAYAPLLRVLPENGIPTTGVSKLKTWAERWYSWASSVFLKEYFATSGDEGRFPRDANGRKRLLEVYLLEKAVYELGYELNNRPDWVGIPLEGILTILRE